MQELKYCQAYHEERHEHERTKAESKKRLAQIRHLLLENHQLHKELDQLREGVHKCFLEAWA